MSVEKNTSAWDSEWANMRYVCLLQDASCIRVKEKKSLLQIIKVSQAFRMNMHSDAGVERGCSNSFRMKNLQVWRWMMNERRCGSWRYIHDWISHLTLQVLLNILWCIGPHQVELPAFYYATGRGFPGELPLLHLSSLSLISSPLNGWTFFFQGESQVTIIACKEMRSQTHFPCSQWQFESTETIYHSARLNHFCFLLSSSIVCVDIRASQ